VHHGTIALRSNSAKQ
jgi:cysteine synthase